MPTITTNGISISYTLHQPQRPRSSEKPHIVLINGLADPKEAWSPQTSALTSAGYRVLTFDNRGIGSSSAPPGPYSAALLAADTKSLVTDLGITRFHLVGVSMGGMIAQEYVLSYPNDVISLTLACTYAAPGPFCSRMFSMWADTASIMGVPHVMRDVLLWAFTQSFFADPTRAADLADFEDAMRFMDQSVPAYLAQLAVIQRFDSRGRLNVSLVQPPTMVLAGEEDVLIPVSLSRRLHELIPGSKWKTVKGGHGCCWEFPREFNEAVIGWVRGWDYDL